MYVSVKKEESISLSSLAMKSRFSASNEERRREGIGDRDFYKTLRNKREEGSKMKGRVSKLKDRDVNQKHPWDKKPDFNFKDSHVKKYKTVHNAEVKGEEPQSKDVKSEGDISKDKKAGLKKDREISKNDKKEENAVKLNSKEEKTAKIDDKKLSESFSDEKKTEEKSLEDLMLELNDIFVNIFESEVSDKFEEAKDLIKDFSSNTMHVDLLSENGTIDLMENVKLEEFSDKLLSSDGSLEESAKLLEEISAFSEELLESLKKVDADGEENSLQDLLTKLNAFSLEIKKTDSEKQNLNAELAIELEEAEEVSLKDREMNSGESFSSNAGKKDGEVNSSVKPAGNILSESAKSDEGFSVKLGDMESVKENEKIDFEIQKNLKAATKTDIFEQIKNNVAKQSIGEEKSEMVINLRPEELGKIELKIQVHKDEVICKMNVASQMVKEAIEANLSDLKMSLKDKGFDVTGFDVNLSDNSSQEDSSENNSYQRTLKRSGLMKVEESLDGVSEIYVKSLEAMEQGSTFEELA